MDAKKLIVKQIEELSKNNCEENLDKSLMLYEQYGRFLAVDISNAICPMNSLVAPITIAYLEGYAKALREQYPESCAFADELKKAKHISISREVK